MIKGDMPCVLREDSCFWLEAAASGRPVAGWVAVAAS